MACLALDYVHRSVLVSAVFLFCSPFILEPFHGVARHQTGRGINTCLSNQSQLKLTDTGRRIDKCLYKKITTKMN